MIRRVFLSFFICFLIISCNKKEDEVSQIEATSVSISEADVTISIGGREKLEIIVEPEGVDLSRSVWRSSDTNIVKVDEKGVVTARAEGKATVSYTTSNSLSKQCKFTVVSSPVSSLVLPDPDFPIGIGLKMFLMGQGFTSGQKIWFRPLQRGDGFKNGNDGDILGVIHEVASNYISVTGGVSGGWYSLLLESGGELFNLGNFQFATYTVPPFEYDPNKILWDDTHWRLFHLRGKVKRIEIHSIDSYVGKGCIALDFNSKGFLIRQGLGDDENPMYSTYYEYDNQNRLSKKSGIDDITYSTYSVSYSTIKYTYGNHDNYIDINSIDALSELTLDHPFINCYDYFESCFGNCFFPVKMYYKGLTNINVKLKTNKGDMISDIDIFVSGDSAYSKFASLDWNFDLKWKFKNGYPVSFFRLYDRPDGFDDYNNGTLTKFNSSGMLDYVRQFYIYNGDTFITDNHSFVHGKPFELFSDIFTIRGLNTHFEYDSNCDILKIIREEDECRDCYFYYMSYDQYGNWTQCVVCKAWGTYDLYKREISYW